MMTKMAKFKGFITIVVLLGLPPYSWCGFPSPAGTYTAKLTLRPERRISLTLSDQNRAEMRTDYLNGEPAVVEIGEWKSCKCGGGRVTVTLTGRDDQPCGKPRVFIFAFSGEDLRAVKYDHTVWGDQSLLFQKQPEEAGMSN